MSGRVRQVTAGPLPLPAGGPPPSVGPWRRSGSPSAAPPRGFSTLMDTCVDGRTFTYVLADQAAREVKVTKIELADRT